MATIKRVRTEWTGLPGGPGLSTIYFTNAATEQQVVDAVRDFWTALNSRICTPAIWTVQGDVDLIDDSTGNIISVQTATPRTGNGSDAGQMLSYGTQGLLNLRTGVYQNGREIRGKIYVPVPSTTSNNDGVPQSTYSAALVTAYAAMEATAAASDVVVYSPTNGLSVPVSAPNPSAYFARLKSRQR